VSRGFVRWAGWVFAVAGVVSAVSAFVAAPHAQTAPAPEDVAAGFRIYRQKADCQACHGWAADGRKMESQMPDGANLRATKLDRAKLVQAVKCGIPGKSMPAFDKFAYTDGRCYGMKQADLKARNVTMATPPATLQPREVDLLADFLFAKIVRQGKMDRAKCVAFWGKEVDACNELPQ